MDISDSFDHKGWSTCKEDYFLTGLYRNGDGNELYKIEEAKCCRPPAVKWGECINHDVFSAFDKKGWTDCPRGYYMAGQWLLFSIEIMTTRAKNLPTFFIYNDLPGYLCRQTANTGQNIQN